MGGIVDTKEVGRRIRQFRQDAGLSQEALAELVGVSFQQVQKYESGHTTLNILKLQQIADALKVQVSDFFGVAPVQHVRLTCLTISAGNIPVRNKVKPLWTLNSIETSMVFASLRSVVLRDFLMKVQQKCFLRSTGTLA